MVHALCLSVGIVVCSDFMLCLINCDAMLHAMYTRTVISALMFTMSVRYIHMRRYRMQYTECTFISACMEYVFHNSYMPVAYSATLVQMSTRVPKFGSLLGA